MAACNEFGFKKLIVFLVSKKQKMSSNEPTIAKLEEIHFQGMRYFDDFLSTILQSKSSGVDFDREMEEWKLLARVETSFKDRFPRGGETEARHRLRAAAFIFLRDMLKLCETL